MRQNKIDLRQLLTEAVVNELKRHYEGLEVALQGDGVNLSGSSDEAVAKARLDLKFYFMNPNLPLENLCSRLDNYNPTTDSQKELLDYAQRLLSLDRTATAGLFMWGDPGVGKTHMTVALTKEFLSREQDAYFLSSETCNLPVHLGPRQVWICDDLNSPYSLYMDRFKEIVLNAHNKGGRVFVTSNASYDSLMERAFSLRPDEKTRYIDRTKQMFKVLHITGSSRREQTAWYK